MRRRWWVIRAEAGDADGTGQNAGGGGGGSADAAGAGADAGGAAAKSPSLLEALGKGGAADAGATGDAGSAGAAGAGDGKALTPEQIALQASEKDTRRPAQVPAKYWDAEKGEVRYEAWAKSTQQLEQRMRDVGLPPKSADEYKYDVPAELKEAGVDLDPAMAKSFREEAHAAGLTQKQYDFVMGKYFGSLSTLADQTKQFSADKARADLMSYYKTEADFNKNVRLAYQAFSAYAGPQDAELIDTIGNIPAVVRILAKVGAELKEDPGVSPDAILDAESVTTLMRGKPGDQDAPYWNPTDPRHKATVAKVRKHHEAQAAANRRRAA